MPPVRLVRWYETSFGWGLITYHGIQISKFVGWLARLVRWLVGWLFCSLVGWLAGAFFRWLVGLSLGWLVDWLVGSFVGWWVGWLVGCLVGSLVRWLVGWFLLWESFVWVLEVDAVCVVWFMLLGCWYYLWCLVFYSNCIWDELRTCWFWMSCLMLFVAVKRTNLTNVCKSHAFLSFSKCLVSELVSQLI